MDKETMWDLNRIYGLELGESLSPDSLKGELADHASEGEDEEAGAKLEKLLADKLNDMIRYDFNNLLQLLYRVDVNETKLRQLLEADTGEDAGMIIARLIIERQRQKIETRRKYSPPGALKGEQEWKDV